VIVFVEVPVAVIRPAVGVVNVSVCPAATLKTTAPPTPDVLSAAIAASIVAYPVGEDPGIE